MKIQTEKITAANTTKFNNRIGEALKAGKMVQVSAWDLEMVDVQKEYEPRVKRDVVTSYHYVARHFAEGDEIHFKGALAIWDFLNWWMGDRHIRKVDGVWMPAHEDNADRQFNCGCTLQDEEAGEFFYGLLARPHFPGSTQPAGEEVVENYRVDRKEHDGRKVHAVLKYDRKLTEDEVVFYSLHRISAA